VCEEKEGRIATQEKTVIPVAKVIYGFGAGALAVWTVQL
jgi:uncharacterized spore protein YtfJ